MRDSSGAVFFTDKSEDPPNDIPRRKLCAVSTASSSWYIIITIAPVRLTLRTRLDQLPPNHLDQTQQLINRRELDRPHDILDQRRRRERDVPRPDDLSEASSQLKALLLHALMGEQGAEGAEGNAGVPSSQRGTERLGETSVGVV
jgi:hypothetical protein